MKILKTKYLNAAELLRFSSGFGWDSTTKRFTASKEVWAEYLKAHPKFKKFRDETFEEFDDLKIIFDKNIATGTNAIGLGETTDAQTVRVAETEKEQANCAPFRNRKGDISQNVLAACNFDLEFIYVLSGWEGSAHDSKILNDVLRKFYLVDCGFANRRNFLAPYRGVRYHLQEFSGQDSTPQNDKELFNHRHASLRNVIERIFGIFKSRFLIFKSAPPFPYKTQTEIVLACVGLHNFLRKFCRTYNFPEEKDSEDVEDVEEVNNNDEEILVTQDQQREHANQVRATIATDMWRDFINV
ncbi:uncharacterized protein LOC125602115 [Brassica napus]|uniref:uncharacterized protein LOC125602115 n=1 Tax=Brassica napus TaxID=3708 RepID=UPI0020788FA8|nr:uncharacterized protein LOC125602115 [Brassica napus]